MSSVNAQPAIQSVSRAIAILRCFAGGEEHGISEVGALVGLHKSTAAGIIYTLRDEGFLEQDEKTGKLRLGLELFSLAVSARHELRQICEPYLSRLLEKTNETVNLGVLSANRFEVVYIAKKESRQSVRISTYVGKRLPVYCTAIGKAILSYMDTSSTEEILGRLEFKPLTENTILDKDTLREQLMRCREKGYANDDEEYEKGVVCMAMPLQDQNGKPIGAVSVSGPSIRMNSAAREQILSALRIETESLCREMSRLI